MNIIEKFLIENCDKKTTMRSYKSHLNTYFNMLNVDPDTYFIDGRDYDDDIMRYWRTIRNYAPYTRSAKISCVKLFFEDNDVILSNKTKKKLRRKLKGSRPATLDVIPTNSQLKKILSHGETKARALGLIASSSGMRLNEILQLSEDDIDFDKDPVKIRVRGETTKTNVARITFMSNEAKDAVLDWLVERNQYLHSAVAKVGGTTGKTIDDDTVFCFNTGNANKIWNRLLEKSGFNERDKTTGYHRMHFHTLRKFFETRMSYAGIPAAIYQQLEGHLGYLDNSYKRFTEKELGEKYNEGVHCLLIFESQPDLTDVHESQRQLRDENKKLQNDVDKLRMELLEVKMKQVQELQRNNKK